VVREPDSETATGLWGEAAQAGTVRVAYVEVRSAIAAAVRSRRVSARIGGQAAIRFDTLWTRLAVVELDEPLASSAADLSEAHGLRALDAIHLAGAVTLPGVVLVTWAERLRQAALAVGLSVAP
jgi:uncharacterized protein